MHLNHILVALSAFALFGCATPSIPYKPTPYENAVSTTSNLTANVVHVTGIVYGSGGMSIVPIGKGIFMPISSGPYPHLQFNEEDQRIFVESFRQELERLHLFKAATANSAISQDAEIKVLFAQTFHNPNFQQYVLDVAMQISSQGKTFANRYRVVSNEGDSWFEKMSTNASEGKAKAGKKLMAALIADVEKWLASK